MPGPGSGAYRRDSWKRAERTTPTFRNRKKKERLPQKNRKPEVLTVGKTWLLNGLTRLSQRVRLVALSFFEHRNVGSGYVCAQSRRMGPGTVVPPAGSGSGKSSAMPVVVVNSRGKARQMPKYAKTSKQIWKSQCTQAAGIKCEASDESATRLGAVLLRWACRARAKTGGMPKKRDVLLVDASASGKQVAEVSAPFLLRKREAAQLSRRKRVKKRETADAPEKWKGEGSDGRAREIFDRSVGSFFVYCD